MEVLSMKVTKQMRQDFMKFECSKLYKHTTVTCACPQEWRQDIVYDALLSKGFEESAK